MKNKVELNEEMICKEYLETEMAKELGYDRIWDCGLIKYVYRNPDYVEEKQFLTDIYY